MMTDSIGTLYIVATPIGNMEDITLRAISILRDADMVVAEDTRHTGQLLAYHHIKASLISCHEYNEKEQIPELIHKLKAGMSVAVVSDAGTPTVSDPGYHLIREAIAQDIMVVPVPGVSAVIAGLSASGLPTDSFLFAGFPARKQGKRTEQLERLSRVSQTLIFYESPARIISFIEDVIRIMGDRYGVLCREMTKLYEEFLRGKLSEILSELEARQAVKGECTLLVSGFEEAEAVSPEEIEEAIRYRLLEKGEKLSELSKSIAKIYGLSRKEVYAMAVRIKDGKQ